MDLHRHVSESSIRPQAYSHLLAYRRDLRRPDFLLTQPVLLDTLRYSLMPHFLHFGRQPGHALAMHSSCPGASSTRSKRRDREALRRISSASCCSAYHLCASVRLPLGFSDVIILFLIRISRSLAWTTRIRVWSDCCSAPKAIFALGAA